MIYQKQVVDSGNIKDFNHLSVNLTIFQNR